MRKLFWVAAALSLALGGGGYFALYRMLPPAEPRPCSTDWDCCKRNPATCKKHDPDLYLQVHEGR